MSILALLSSLLKKTSGNELAALFPIIMFQKEILLSITLLKLVPLNMFSLLILRETACYFRS